MTQKEGTFQIDLTPTWRGLAPVMIELVGGNTDTKEGQQNALAEFGRVFEMACNMATNHELHDIRTSARVLIFDLCEMVDRQNQLTKDKESK